MVNFHVIKVDSLYTFREALVTYSKCSCVYPPLETEVHI